MINWWKSTNKIYERESNDDKSCGWKQKYNPKNLKALDYQPAELETKSLADGNRSDLKQPTQLKQLRLNKISKPLWVNLSRQNFNSLIKDVVDNLDNADYNRRYDLKNAEKFLLEIITKKNSEKEACWLIKPHFDTLMKSRIRGKNKRGNILNVLNNIKPGVFDGVYLNYFDNPSESEECIIERTKLRRPRFDEIAIKEKMISSKLFEKYFDYSSPSNMYRALNETTGSEENKTQVNMIENRLANLMDVLKSSTTC